MRPTVYLATLFQFQFQHFFGYSKELTKQLMYRIMYIIENNTGLVIITYEESILKIGSSQETVTNDYKNF